MNVSTMIMLQIVFDWFYGYIVHVFLWSASGYVGWIRLRYARWILKPLLVTEKAMHQSATAEEKP